MRRGIWHCAILASLATATLAIPARGEETREQTAERQRREQEERANALRAQLPQPPNPRGDEKRSDNPGDPSPPLNPRGPIDPGYRPAAEGPNGQVDSPPPRNARRVPSGSEPVNNQPSTTPLPPRGRPINSRPAGGQVQRPVSVIDLFRKLDLDGDGVLSLEEFRHVFDRPDATSSTPTGDRGEASRGGETAPPRRPDTSREGAGEPQSDPNDAPVAQPRERNPAVKSPAARGTPTDAPPSVWKDEPTDADAAPKAAR